MSPANATRGPPSTNPSMTTRLTIPAAVAAFLLSLPVPSLAQDPLPDGPGKDVVVRVCAACHQLSTVIGRRREFDDWRLTIEGMASRGAEGTDEEFAIVLRYLAR